MPLGSSEAKINTLLAEKAEAHEVAPLSKHVARARVLLLMSLQTQLAQPLATHLNPENAGVPFLDVDEDAPQLMAIKKVMNCLYHAEEALIIWEHLDTSSAWAKAKSAPQGVKALTQIYKAVALLNDATPEIQAVIANNYGLLKPIFSGAYDAIKSSNWLSQFASSDVIDSANAVLAQGESHSSLISVFETLAQLMNLVADLNANVLSQLEKKSKFELIRSLLETLDRIPALGQLSVKGVAGSKALNKLTDWLSSIDENDQQFTQQFMQKFMQQYILWSNHHAPALICAIDKLEQQNYLKAGLLSQDFCTALDRVSESLSHSSFVFDEQISSVDSFSELRAKQIDATQDSQLQVLLTLDKQKSAADQFFAILMAYKGEAYSAITEADRQELRQLYPDLQPALAHHNLQLENQFTAVLNETTVEDKSWRRWASNQLYSTLNYVVSSEVDSLAVTHNALLAILDKQSQTAALKLAVADKSREYLKLSDQRPYNERLQVRISAIKQDLDNLPESPPVLAGTLVAVNAASLNNLRGNVAALQELQLSKAVGATRTALVSVVHSHISKKNAAPHTIKEEEPELFRQTKQVESSLLHLESSLKNFEKLDRTQGSIANLKALFSIASAAYKLNSSLRLLSPEASNYLAPVLQQSRVYAFQLSKISQPNSLAELKKLEAPHAPDALESYRENLAQTRSTLLSRLQNTLSNPLSSRLNTEEKGVPFIHLDRDPPQIRAIKKITNCLYYAEAAIKIVLRMDVKETLGQITATHQGVVAISQLYKSLKLLMEAAPEVRNIISDNYDLLQPAFNSMKALFGSDELLSQFNSEEIGRFLGKGLNTIFPENKGSGPSFSIIRFAAELPVLANQLSSQIRDDSVADDLSISDKKINALHKILNMLANEKISFSLVGNGADAYSGLMEIIASLNDQTKELSIATLTIYQQRLDKIYPDVLSMFDDLEQRYYLKPGILSQHVANHMDVIHGYLNKMVAYTGSNSLSAIHYATSYTDARISSLEKTRKSYWIERFKTEEQQKAATTFFSILNSYTAKELAVIAPVDFLSLKTLFVSIQDVFAQSDLELTNDWINGFSQPEASFKIAQLMQQKIFVEDFLNQKQKANELKIDVVNQAISELKPKESANRLLSLEQIQLESVRKEFNENLELNIHKQGLELKAITASSVNNARGNVAYIQELQISSLLKPIREQFLAYNQAYLSKFVLGYLVKPDTLHVIKSDDPFIVRQLKEIENNLFLLEDALLQFEHMNTTDTLISQIKTLMGLGYHAQQLLDSLQNISAGLKEQYGPLVNNLVALSQKMIAIDYSAAYSKGQDLHTFIYGDDHNPLAYLEAGTRMVQKASSHMECANDYLKQRYETDLSDEEQRRRYESLFNRFTEPDNAHDLSGKTFASAIYFNLAKQLTLLNRRVDEFGDALFMKEIIYKEFLLPLSQEEDRLYLKPGTLLNPAMKAVNQFFLSIVLQLNTSFKSKLELLDEARFINIIGDKTQSDLYKLTSKLHNDLENTDLFLAADTKADKVSYLNQQNKSFSSQSPLKIKQALLDAYFDAYLREQVENAKFKSPIREQYQNDFREYYAMNKAHFLNDEIDSGKALSLGMKGFNDEHLCHYFMVDRGLDMLHALKNLCTSDAGKEVYVYLSSLTNTLENAALPIVKRYDIMKGLPGEAVFNKKISSLIVGANFLVRFNQFIATAVSAVLDAVATGGNLIEIYERKRTERIINNITTIRDDLAAMRTEHDGPKMAPK